MTRIIAGSAGGRLLKTPGGTATRPTSDRVREALFSTLEASLAAPPGRRFLDLYAGSGAVGLEARSRWACDLTCVEASPAAAKVIAANAASLGLEPIEIVVADAGRVVARQSARAYDVVFADPPYVVATDVLNRVLADLCGMGWLDDEAVVVVERSRGSSLPWAPCLEQIATKRYGDTILWYGRKGS